MFALGIPILAWTVLDITRRKPEWRRKILVWIVVICAFEASIQLVGSLGFINKVNTLGTVASELSNRFRPGLNGRIFSDEGTVVALSGLSESIFLTSADAPRDREEFLKFLREKNVEYLVFVEKEDSTPSKLFPELGNGNGNDLFQPVMHAGARFLPTNVWLYRVRN